MFDPHKEKENKAMCETFEQIAEYNRKKSGKKIKNVDEAIKKIGEIICQLQDQNQSVSLQQLLHLCRKN